MSNLKYTKELLEEAVKVNISYLGVLRTLGAPLRSGSTRNNVVKRIKSLNIDSSHFLGQRANSGHRHVGGIKKRVLGKTKICLKCNRVRRLSSFYQRKKYRTGDYYEKCKDCMKDRGRKYYQDHRDRQLPLALKRKQLYKSERKLWVNKLKDKPCCDCGGRFPPHVMDFDHKDNEIKVDSVSRLLYWSTSNLEKIKNEIAKCELVCANCHRQRTYNRIHKETSATVAKLVTAEL